jgi:hypothetical protein
VSFFEEPLMGRSAVVCRLIVMAACVVGVSSSEAFGRDAEPRRRSPPPTLPWGRLVTDAFFDDAFTTLDGPRPDFSRRTPGAATAGAPLQAGAEPDPAGGFRWSSLTAAETLVDEIKDRAGELQAALDTPAGFKGGGYQQCRTLLTTIATMFGVIAAYDGDVRWKEEAGAARDLFARAGFNCKAGSDQTYAEAKARAEDLQSMIQGGRLDRPAGVEVEEDVAWSDVAARSPLMQRLELAEKTLAEAASSASAFQDAVDVVLHEAELAAVITQVLQEPELDDHDDETYRSYAAAMGEAARGLREAAGQGDYQAASSAIGRLKQSCDTCHGDYR